MDDFLDDMTAEPSSAQNGGSLIDFDEVDGLFQRSVNAASSGAQLPQADNAEESAPQNGNPLSSGDPFGAAANDHNFDVPLDWFGAAPPECLPSNQTQNTLANGHDQGQSLKNDWVSVEAEFHEEQNDHEENAEPHDQHEPVFGPSTSTNLHDLLAFDDNHEEPAQKPSQDVPTAPPKNSFADSPINSPTGGRNADDRRGANANRVEKNWQVDMRSMRGAFEDNNRSSAAQKPSSVAPPPSSTVFAHSDVGHNDAGRKSAALANREARRAAATTSSRFGDKPDANACCVCDKRVYPLERVTIAGRVYHKSCARCTKCNRALEYVYIILGHTVAGESNGKRIFDS